MQYPKLNWYYSIDLVTDTTNKQYRDLPGFANYKDIHKFFAANLSLTDRYQTTQLPIQTNILDVCKPPAFVKQTLEYDEICLFRAKQLMNHAINTNRKLFIMYSGGIDSSAIICSFLLACTPDEIKNNIVVGLSESSIKENPILYKKFIVGKFERVSSNVFSYYLGHPDYITINGEGNDQLFGSDLIQSLTLRFGEGILHTPRTDAIIYDCFNNGSISAKTCDKFIEVFNKATSRAPVGIDTVFHYFWWINFQYKWHNVYMRMLSFAKAENVSAIKPNDNYFSFFQTDEFQLWTLNNTNSLIKDTWKSYKYVCKDFIYSVTNDANYRDRKSKFGSLSQVTMYKPVFHTIDENFVPSNTPVDTAYWNMQNDFI